MSCCDPSDLFNVDTFEFPDVSDTVSVIIDTMHTMQGNSSLESKEEVAAETSSNSLQTVDSIFPSIHSLFLIAWYTIFKSDKTMNLKEFDEMSISQVLANTGIENFNGLLLFTVTFATILFSQTICIVMKIWKGLNQNDPKNRNRWSKRMEKRCVNISILACLSAWFFGIGLIICDVYSHSIFHLIAEFILVLSLSTFELSFSYLLFRYRYYEMLKANNCGQTCCRAFYFCDGLFFLILFGTFIVQMIFYSLKYVKDPSAITDACNPLTPNIHTGIRGYKYEWNAFIITLIYFQAMTFTAYKDPISSDVISDIKEKIWTYFKNVETTTNVEHKLRHQFKLTSKAIEDILLLIGPQNPKWQYLFSIKTLIQQYSDRTFDNSCYADADEILTDSDDDIDDSSDDPDSQAEFPWGHISAGNTDCDHLE